MMMMITMVMMMRIMMMMMMTMMMMMMIMMMMMPPPAPLSAPPAHDYPGPHVHVRQLIMTHKHMAVVHAQYASCIWLMYI